MLHLLVASFRALPLDLMVPVSRRGFVWIFSWIFFFLLLFVFFSLSFFSGFFSIQNALSLQHCQSGHLRTCAQLEIRRAASARKEKKKKEKKKFGTIYHFDINLIWSGCVHRGHLPFVSEFQAIAGREKRGTLQKMSNVVVAPRSAAFVCFKA